MSPLVVRNGHRRRVHGQAEGGAAAVAILVRDGDGHRARPGKRVGVRHRRQRAGALAKIGPVCWLSPQLTPTDQGKSSVPASLKLPSVTVMGSVTPANCPAGPGDTTGAALAMAIGVSTVAVNPTLLVTTSRATKGPSSA